MRFAACGLARMKTLKPQAAEPQVTEEPNVLRTGHSLV